MRERTARHVAVRMRARTGQVIPEHERAAMELALAQDAERAAGHGLVRFTGYAAVTVTDPAALADACAALEADAAAARVELRRMWFAQDSGFALAALPVGMGPAEEAVVSMSKHPPALAEVSLVPYVGYPAVTGDKTQVPERSAGSRSHITALIQGHRETRQVMSMLPGSAFADLLRREIFHAIRSLFASDRPIDPLTVDWEVTRSRASSGRQETEAAADSGDSYVTRLSRLSIGDDPVTRTADALIVALSQSGNGSRMLHSVSGPAARPGTGQAPVGDNSDPADSSPRLLQPPPRLPGPDRGREQQM